MRKVRTIFHKKENCRLRHNRGKANGPSTRKSIASTNQTFSYHARGWPRRGARDGDQLRFNHVGGGADGPPAVPAKAVWSRNFQAATAADDRLWSVICRRRRVEFTHAWERLGRSWLTTIMTDRRREGNSPNRHLWKSWQNAYSSMILTVLPKFSFDPLDPMPWAGRKYKREE